ncbi:hypothetical protein C8A01DRAFT_50298 [Parachaetomium inaequale]|uniref:SET domain-containing protein n=1 Tax=Parachaetomium inaequale TaxID=2588326 RepID=A0AAN6SMU1_9PEZI|nr:hypothetical protein C8A01DRAFT_50298 [Parachaetomium inaequale]
MAISTSRRLCSWGADDGSLILQSNDERCPLASDWSPWSHQPVCLEAQAAEDHDSESVSADCVFTLATFRGNQGISVITTPDLAISLAEYFDDSRVSPGLRGQLARTGQNREDEKAAYELRDLPGRGKGVVAKRGFAERETIMVGFPVLVIRLDFINGDHYPERQKRSMMNTSDGSRVNHNCRPNSFWRYVNSNMAMEVVALRDIRAGEEIAQSCKG